MHLVEAGSPFGPVRQGASQGIVGTHVAALLLVGRRPLETEVQVLSFPNGKEGLVAHVLAHERYRAVQLDGVGPRHGPDARIGLDHPRDLGAVLEADKHFGHHFHLPRQTLHPAEHTGAVVPRRHEVSYAHKSLRSVPFLDQDQGPLLVMAPLGCSRPLGGEQPSAVVGSSQEGGKAGGRVEAGHAQPIERTVPAHQGGGMGVADQGIILDPLAHEGSAVGA